MSTSSSNPTPCWTCYWLDVFIFWNKQKTHRDLFIIYLKRKIRLPIFHLLVHSLNCQNPKGWVSHMGDRSPTTWKHLLPFSQAFSRELDKWNSQNTNQCPFGMPVFRRCLTHYTTTSDLILSLNSVPWSACSWLVGFMGSVCWIGVGGGSEKWGREDSK